jgi:hypothetical protein
MNERIKELALQVYGSAATAQEIKFAELILKECCEILLKWKSEPFPFDEDTAVSLLKEYFNIKK